MRDFLGRITVVVLLSPLLVGCGGSGGGSAPVVPQPLTTSLRVVQAADLYAYTVSASVPKTGGGTVPLSGSALIRVNIDTLEGASVWRVQSQVSLWSGGTNVVEESSENYYRQEATNHDLLLLAATDTSNVFRKASTPYLDIPGTFGLSVGFNQVRTFEGSGSTSNVGFTVVGTEVVVTPVGAFTSWKCTSTSQVGTTQTVQTKWFAPQLGFAPVKQHLETTDTTTGAKTTEDLLLKQTSVTL